MNKEKYEKPSIEDIKPITTGIVHGNSDPDDVTTPDPHDDEEPED
jgi:hypothetical protein